MQKCVPNEPNVICSCKNLSYLPNNGIKKLKYAQFIIDSTIGQKNLIRSDSDSILVLFITSDHFTFIPQFCISTLSVNEFKSTNSILFDLILFQLFKYKDVHICILL